VFQNRPEVPIREKCKVNVKVKFYLCLTKYDAMKTCPLFIRHEDVLGSGGVALYILYSPNDNP